jgi:hypothetical protein
VRINAGRIGAGVMLASLALLLAACSSGSTHSGTSTGTASTSSTSTTTTPTSSGPTASTGATGSTAGTGATAATGATGSTAATGATGTTGSTAATGATGATGNSGTPQCVAAQKVYGAVNATISAEEADDSSVATYVSESLTALQSFVATAGVPSDVKSAAETLITDLNSIKADTADPSAHAGALAAAASQQAIPDGTINTFVGNCLGT